MNRAVRQCIAAACRRATVALALAALTGAPWSVLAQTQPEPKLIVTPAFGRPNDVFYLAGGGFPPSQPLSVTMFCPNWTDSRFGHWSWTISVGRTGTFAAYAAHVPTPLLVSHTPCMLYARDGDNPLGVGVPFHILPAEQQYPPPPLTIHLTIRVQRDQPTTMEMVDVQSAPGAQVVFTVFYPNAKPWTYRTRLPWTGQKNLRWRIPPQTKGNRILVTARAKLGGLTGHTSMWFRGGNAPSSRQSRSSPGH